MITEHALLRVRAAEQAAFEAAMIEARALIASSPGFHGIEVCAAAEEAGLYLLLVKWDNIASHRDGFRKSDRYAKWQALLHGFYDPKPDVHYFKEAFV